MILNVHSTMRNQRPASCIGRLAIVPLMLTLAGCNGALGRPDVYNIAPSQAYQLLTNVDLARTSDRPFGAMKVTITGEPDKSVTWTGEWIVCTIGIAPVESTKSQISVSCNGGENERGVEGMIVTNTRLEVIEQIDAVLKQRPYDKRLADGTTAFGWPADPAHHAGMSEARSDALGTMSNIAAQDEALEKEAAQRKANPAASANPQSDVPFGQADPDAGKPAMNSGN